MNQPKLIPDKVQVFSSKTCYPCMALLSYLDMVGVGYEVLKLDDPDPAVARANELKSKALGCGGLPFLVIEVDGQTFTLQGYQREAVNKFLTEHGFSIERR